MNTVKCSCTRPRGHWRALLLACALLFATAIVVAQSAAPPASTPAAEAPGVPGKGIVGSWFGALKAGPMTLRLGLEVTEANGKLAAEFDSIDQNAKIPVAMISGDEAGAKFEIPMLRGTYDGKYSADGSELVGTWTQNGNSMPLTFKRQAKPFALVRPQEPKKPYPYLEEEVTFSSAPDVKLAGTLTLPQGKHQGKGLLPAVVLMTGSGPQDRDEALMGHKPFLVLADHLTRAGIAVLRYDDRGVAKSTGNFRAATHFDFAADGRAAFQYLKTRSEIDPKRIGVLGHSEGSVYAPYIAKEEKDLAFVVLLAGAGVPIKELLDQQGADTMKASGADYQWTAEDRADNDAIYARLAEKKLDADTEKFIREKIVAIMARHSEEQKKKLGFNQQAVEMRVRMSMTPWFVELLSYDAAKELQNIRVPVLALFGAKDVQVAAASNTAGMKAAFEKAGNRKVTFKTFEGLNHVFQHANTGAPSEYDEIEETMSPEVLDTVAQWIGKQR